MEYISDPKTSADHAHNAEFQLNNVQGYLSIKDYESALIKAELLVESLRLASVKSYSTLKEMYDANCYFCGARASGYSMVKIEGVESLEPTCKDHQV